MSSRARLSAACMLALVLLAGVLVATAAAANEFAEETAALNEDAVSVSSAALTNAEQLEALLEADEVRRNQVILNTHKHEP
jgi:hypothetical protein